MVPCSLTGFTSCILLLPSNPAGQIGLLIEVEKQGREIASSEKFLYRTHSSAKDLHDNSSSNM